MSSKLLCVIVSITPDLLLENNPTTFVYRVIIELCVEANNERGSIHQTKHHNVSNAASQSIFIGSTTFNNTLASCNNSPVFSNTPLPFICAGQSTVLSMGATDPDGDSLAYSLGPCYISSLTTPVTYNAGYSPTQPMGPS